MKVEAVGSSKTTEPERYPEMRVDPIDWDDAIAPVGRPQIIVGGPGTGKTEFLVRRIAAAVTSGIDPHRILALGFSRRGVGDVRRRLVDVIGAAAHSVAVTTFHGVARGIVDEHAIRLGWKHPPTILTAVEQQQLIGELLTRSGPDGWPPGFRTILDTPAFAGEVADFILRYHEQQLTGDWLEAAGDPRLAAMARFIRRYEAELSTIDRIDYGLVLTEAARALRLQPDASPYLVVACDEYQDTSPAQAELLFALAGRSGDLTVTADPYQSTYSFRGSDVNNVFEFPSATTERLGRPAQRIVLTTSFRVPSEILAAAVNVTARELPGGAGKVESTRSGGRVATHLFPDLAQEAEWIASDIERVHVVDGVAYDRVAVFTRSNSDFDPEMLAALDRRGIPYSADEARLADEPIIRFIEDLVQIATRSDLVGALRRVLCGPMIGLTFAAASDVLAAVEDEGIEPAIGRRVPEGEHLARLLADATWATQWAAPEGLWHAWSTLPQFLPIALDDDRASDRSALAAFAQVLDRLTERSPAASLEDYFGIVSSAGFEAEPLLSFNTASRGVALASLHAAKGTSYDIVYIANATEGRLPDLRARDSLLGARLLNEHLPRDPGAYVAFRLDEERRLAYTAMTRASSRVVWTATTDPTDDAVPSPSRFLELVAPITPAPHVDEPLTPRSFEAALRRIASDPLAQAVDRLASLDLIARGPSLGLADPLDRYGTLAPGPDDGLVPDTPSLSPTAAQTYSTCPFRFAVERYVTLRQEDSPYLRFGTLIHDVLEHAEREAITDGAERSTLAAAQRHLDELWPESGFGDTAVGRSWYRRASTVLDTMYELWPPSSGPPVALERPVEAIVAGVRWRGRVDRIERRGDRLVVVDYKTGGTAPTRDDAAVSIQLAFYVMAARNDAELNDHGVVGGAEMWFPRARPTKTSIATRRLDTARLDEVVEQMHDISRSVVAGHFDPTPGKHCDRCPHRRICPAVGAEREAFAP